MMFDLVIKEWLESITSYSILPTDGHAHIHIDDLLDITLPNPDAVGISIQAFKTLIKYVGKWETPVKLSLAIPMKSIGNKISLMVPQNIEDITSQLDFEPPSLWVIDWQSFYSPTLLRPIILEEYRSPIGFNIMEINDKSIVTYYHEYRSKEEFETNQVIHRQIYIDCFKYPTLERFS